MKMILRNRGISAYRTSVLLEARNYLFETVIGSFNIHIKQFRFYLDINSKRSEEWGYQADDAKFPGVYAISVSRDATLNNSIKFLCHEFIHLKQSVSKELIVKPIGIQRGQYYWYWKDEFYGVNPYGIYKTADDHYKFLPWETEAYDGQTELFNKFCKISKKYKP